MCFPPSDKVGSTDSLIFRSQMLTYATPSKECSLLRRWWCGDYLIKTSQNLESRADLAWRKPTRLQRGYRLSLNHSYQFANNNNSKKKKEWNPDIRDRITGPAHQCGLQVRGFMQDLQNFYFRGSLWHLVRHVTLACEIIKASQNIRKWKWAAFCWSSFWYVR